MFLVRELSQEQQRCLNRRPRRKEDFARQAYHGQKAGAVFAKLADIGEGRVIEDPFGQDDAHTPARLEQRQAALNKEDFCLDLADFFARAAPFRQLEERSNRPVLGRIDAGLGFLVKLPVDVGVMAVFIVAGLHVGVGDVVRRFDVRPEGRIG